jgi:hypothetical protein
MPLEAQQIFAMSANTLSAGKPGGEVAAGRTASWKSRHPVDDALENRGF